MTLKKEIIHGVFWTGLQKYSGIFVQLLVTMVLARLIPPEEFGIIAIATIFTTFIGIFADMGLGAAIIQHQDLQEYDLHMIFSFTLYLGLLLMLLLGLCSLPIAHFYGQDALIPILSILSVSLFFSTATSVSNALLLKHKRFRFLARRTLTLQVLGGVLSILAALSGWRCYALLVAPTLTSIGTFLLNQRQYPLHFFPRVDLKPVRRIFSYASFLLLFNIVNYFARNLDKLIIGKYLSLEQLGYYEKSYRLMLMPVQNITFVITPVLHPLLANLQNDYHHLYRKFNQIIRLLSYISFPLSVYLCYGAQDIILLIFGPDWIEAAPVFQILSLSLPIQMILSSTGTMYQITGHTDTQFYNGLLTSPLMVGAFILAASLFRSTTAIAWSFNLALLLNFIITFHLLYRRTLKQSPYSLLPILLPPALLFGTLWILLGSTYAIFSSPWLRLLYGAALSAALTGLLVLIRHLLHRHRPN